MNMTCVVIVDETIVNGLYVQNLDHCSALKNELIVFTVSTTKQHNKNI